MIKKCMECILTEDEIHHTATDLVNNKHIKTLKQIPKEITLCGHREGKPNLTTLTENGHGWWQKPGCLNCGCNHERTQKTC